VHARYERLDGLLRHRVGHRLRAEQATQIQSRTKPGRFRASPSQTDAFGGFALLGFCAGKNLFWVDPAVVRPARATEPRFPGPRGWNLAISQGEVLCVAVVSTTVPRAKPSTMGDRKAGILNPESCALFLTARAHVFFSRGEDSIRQPTNPHCTENRWQVYFAPMDPAPRTGLLLLVPFPRPLAIAPFLLIRGSPRSHPSVQARPHASQRSMRSRGVQRSVNTRICTNGDASP